MSPSANASLETCVDSKRCLHALIAFCRVGTMCLGSLTDLACPAAWQCIKAACLRQHPSCLLPFRPNIDFSQAHNPRRHPQVIVLSKNPSLVLSSSASSFDVSGSESASSCVQVFAPSPRYSRPCFAAAVAVLSVRAFDMLCLVRS
jgi:hypothetical protein